MSEFLRFVTTKGWRAAYFNKFLDFTSIIVKRTFTPELSNMLQHRKAGDALQHRRRNGAEEWQPSIDQK